MQSQERVNDLIFICERMITILKAENTALKEFKVSPVSEHLEEKTKLSLFYERHMKSVRRNPESYKAVEKDLLETLKDLGQSMDELLDENGKLLKIAMETNRRVLKATVAAAKAHVPHSGAYGNTGHVGPQGNQSVAVSINNEF